MRLSLKDHGPTEVHDRKYFLSLYVRDPAGILMEYATDGPGMTVDEAERRSVWEQRHIRVGRRRVGGDRRQGRGHGGVGRHGGMLARRGR